VDHDHRAARLQHLGLLEVSLGEQPVEARVGGLDDLPAAVQAQDPRRALERAQHHDDAPVLAQVGDRLGAAAHEVEVRDRVVVEHPQRADRALGRDVDVPVAVERRGADEEQGLARDPVALVLVDPLVDAAH
jgi:hypothetical protein